MWKNSVYAFILGTALLLVGCNTGNNNAAGYNNNGLNDGVNERGHNDTLDNHNNTYDNRVNGNGVNNGTGNMAEDFNAENGTIRDGSISNGAGQNANSGVVPNNDRRILNDNQEDIIEDQVDVRDRDTKDE